MNLHMNKMTTNLGSLLTALDLLRGKGLTTPGGPLQSLPGFGEWRCNLRKQNIRGFFRP